jgi:hypothetical protein
MSESKLTKKQIRTYGPRAFAAPGYRDGSTITATVRYDDECGNGHNTFAITADIREPDRGVTAGGCLHDEVARYFPEIAGLIKWHLVSSDEPMHYIENTMYWLGYRGWCDGKYTSPPNLAHARSSAVWPDMPEEFLAPLNMDFGQKRNQVLGERIEAVLRSRLQALKIEFRAAVESLGFEY